MSKSEMYKFFAQRLPASPQMCRAILRAVALQPSVDEAGLSALVRPTTIVDMREAQFGYSLEILRDLELLTGRKQWKVADDFSEAAGDLAAFRRAFRAALVRHARAAIDAGDEPSDLYQGIVWLSLQSHSSSLELAGIPQDLSDSRGKGFGNAIVTDEQWRGLREWSIALGFARDTGSRKLIPDFSTAVADALPQCDPMATVADFLAAIGHTVPSLYDSAAQSWYSRTRPLPEPAQLSPVLSWALAGLRHRSRLVPSQKDDAAAPVAFAPPVGLVSHVEVPR